MRAGRVVATYTVTALYGLYRRSSGNLKGLGMGSKADGGLRPLFRDKMPGFWQAIETGGTGRGIPDSHFCIDGVCGWVEFKTCEAIQVGLRPEQVAWIHRYVRNGGRAFVIVRHKHEGGPRKGPPVDDLYVYPGSQVIDLKRQGLALEPLIQHTTDPFPLQSLLHALLR